MPETNLTNLIEIGRSKGYIELIKKATKNYIRYIYIDKEYNFDDPEEVVRARTYVELIEKYNYPIDKIKLEVYPPVREGGRPSDIVVYDLDNFPFLVVETKKETASLQEMQDGIREIFGNANLFGVRWAMLNNGIDEKAYFSLVNFSLVKESDLRAANIPKRYGQPEKFTYGKGTGFNLSVFGEISKFQKIIKKCHNIIRDNENLSPTAAFPVISRIIYTKVFDELNTPDEGFYSFQIGKGEKALDLASRIASRYKKASSIKSEIFSPILGVEKPDTLYQIVELLQSYSFYDSPYDIKGEAYQAFLSRLMRGSLGQFFTPREIVKPTIDILAPRDDEKVIDPCCGTGGFLVYAYKSLRENIRTKYGEQRVQFRKEYDVAHYNIFGIEADQNVAESCIAGMLLEDDAHSHIAVTDALSEWNNPIFVKNGIGEGKFKVLMTNPPFGKKNRLEERRSRFAMVEKFTTPPFETLILERSIELLEPGGRAGFVIPDIDLSSKEVLDFLWEKVIILGVVSLPSETFNPYGSQAKTSVLFFKKRSANDNNTVRIFLASVDQIGYDATGRKKGNGKNYYEDVALYFKRFLDGDEIESVKENGFEIYCLEGDNISKAKTNLKVDSYLLEHKQKKGDFELLNSVAVVIRGHTPAWAEYAKSGIPILKVRNLTNQFLKFSFEHRGYVPETIYKKHPGAHIRLNDILLTASAHKLEYIAKKIDIVDMLPGNECMACGEVLIIRPNSDKIDPFYLLSVLRTKKINDQIRSRITGTTAHIYPDDIGKNVFIPRLSSKANEKEIGDRLRKSLRMFRDFEVVYADYEEFLNNSIKEFDE